MSELIPNILALDKGLDLQSPKLTAPPGSVLDSLNYEQVDFQGQKRIDGFVRYDGGPLSAVYDVYLMENVDTLAEAYTLPVCVYNDVPFGVVVGSWNNGPMYYARVAVFDRTALPPDGAWASTTDWFTPEEFYDMLLEVNAELRAQVQHAVGPISGLHWFKDRLYAVMDISSFTPPDPRIDMVNRASLFESKSITQAMKEGGNVGWNFIHQGWTLRFKDMNVPSGLLVAKNQNRENVGVQGPTPTGGTAGSAKVVTQKMAISNLPQQVNGWKTSTSPSVYNLEAGALQDGGGAYIYADAYFSWDGASGTISAFGITGGDLIEYPPTNTVEVEV